MTTETLDSTSITMGGTASEVVDSGALEKSSGSSIDLTKVSLADVALAQFGEWREQVKNAKDTLKGLVLDMPTQAKVDEFKSLRQRLINVPRADARRVAKDVKSKLSKTSKVVGEAEEQIVAAWDEVETIITPSIDKRQAELDEERATKAAGQAFRVALHNALIARINGYVESAQGLTSERISKGVDFVEALTFGDECQEFKPKYEEAQKNTLATLRKMLSDAQAQEAAETQRLENERVARELAEQREALEKQSAELLAQRVAATHAIVFAFPDPEPEPAPAPAATVSVAPVSLVAANNAARAEIASAAEPVATIRVPKPDSEPPVPTPPAPRAEAAPVAAPAARITLGQINERLAPIAVTAAGLAELGFTHTTEKASKQYPETDFPKICKALIKHISEVTHGAAVAA